MRRAAPYAFQAREIERRIKGLNLRPKTENLAGLQLADLVATPIGRCNMGKTIKEDCRIIEAKFRRSRAGNHEDMA